MPEPTRPSDLPPFRYSAALAATIESTWQERWDKEGTFNTPNPAGALAEGFDRVNDRPKLFVMDMFPYPSGDGLHVGHPLGYIGTDVYARFKRMSGFNVLHTMGYDAFGLPAEQYALQTGTHPRIRTESNIANMSRQLRRLGLGHDPRRAISTTDPGYYRWTQWIFLRLFESWYDPSAGDDGKGRARPVAALVAELESGARATPDGRPWGVLSVREQREVVDGYRLAYVAEAPVNWCPGLGTVVANEEVTNEGRSDRGNFPVFKRNMRQWMMRITAYADRLIDDLELVDWPEAVKTMQRNWIGRSLGARVDFPVDNSAHTISVFTTRADTLFGATYMVLAPEHPLVDELTAASWPSGVDQRWTGDQATPADAVRVYRAQAAARTDVSRQDESREKTGVFIGAHAINPVNGEKIPVFTADYVLMGYGTGAIMAVPSGDQRDFEFAQAFGLPIVATVQPSSEWLAAHGIEASTAAVRWPMAYAGDGALVNSRNDTLDMNGMTVEQAKAAINDWLAANNHGYGTVNYKLRDWLFSRQRYWGEPFPIVYPIEGPLAGMPMPLPDGELPVALPETDQFTPRTFDPDDAASNPEAPLDRLEWWADVTLDLGDGPRRYRRDTNVMPQWAGSCWYYLRYIDPVDENRVVDPANERYWMGTPRDGFSAGVDLYVGGVEHAVLHLLYSRFWQKVLYDLGVLTTPEPFHRLFNQGYIQAAAYTDDRGSYVNAAEVEERDGRYYYDGTVVSREYGKMGKSLKNVVTPDEMFEHYGADTLRVYEMSMGPLELSRPWETRAVPGAHRLLQRIWRAIVDEDTGEVKQPADAKVSDETRRILHRTVAAVREAMDELRFNTPIARITELNNHLTQTYPDGLPREVAEPLVLLLAPFAPHLAEELWSKLGHAESLTWQPFPQADRAYLVDDTVEVPVQVNGKVRSRVVVAAGIDAAALEAAARGDERVASLLEGKTVRKVIAVPDRLVNFVVS